MNRLWRAREDALIAGVCAGIARQFEWSVWAVRLAWVLVALVTLKIALLAYLIAALILVNQFKDSETGKIESKYQALSETIYRLRYNLIFLPMAD